MKVNEQAVASYTRRPTLIYISAHVSSPRVFGVYSRGRVSTTNLSSTNLSILTWFITLLDRSHPTYTPTHFCYAYT